MKRFFTRLLSTVLTVLIVVGVREGFDYLSSSRKIDKLAGTYVANIEVETATAEELLTANDFYAEEIALVDLTTLSIPKYVEFHSGKTYTFYYDTDAYRDNVEAFFRQAFDSMYEGRHTLTALYDQDLSAMSTYEFQEFYASLYSCSNFEHLMDTLADGSWNYESLKQKGETGTYTIEGSNLHLTITGHYSAEQLGYKLSDNVLTLTYSDGTEIYHRVS